MPIMRWIQKLLSSRPAPAAAGPDRTAIGRNDPCWCGSGKKYKKCHLSKDTAERVEAAYSAQFSAKNQGPGAVTRSGPGAKARRPEEAKEWKGKGKER